MSVATVLYSDIRFTSSFRRGTVLENRSIAGPRIGGLIAVCSVEASEWPGPLQRFCVVIAWPDYEDGFLAEPIRTRPANGSPH